MMQNHTYAKLCLFLLIFSLFNPYAQFASAATITATEDVTVSATVGGSTTPPGGGGSGGSVSLPPTSVRFSGEAYPNAIVTILKNGVIVASVQAGLDGLFSATLQEQYDSTILYSLFARDVDGNKSLLINYPLVVRAGYLTYLSGIRFPPTISLDKIEVKIGGFLNAFGYAMPKRELQAVIEDKNKQPTIFTLNARDTGRYNIILPLMGLGKGDYSIYVKYTNDTRISKLLKFIIGDANLSSMDAALNMPGDCNADKAINLVDFSVMAFWYKKPNPPLCVDINKDQIVDLTDFSILAFYWTN